MNSLENEALVLSHRGGFGHWVDATDQSVPQFSSTSHAHQDFLAHVAPFLRVDQITQGASQRVNRGADFVTVKWNFVGYRCSFHSL